MKKSLLAVLLAVALVAPVFATEKGDMEVDVKAGVPIYQGVHFEDSYITGDADMDTTFLLGADFFYYVDSKIAVGVGIDYISSSKIKNDYWTGLKIGWTNLYAQVKPIIPLKNDIFNSIYFLGQIGYGIMHDNDFDNSSATIDNENGLYWAIGAGTTVKENFIVELLYSVDYGKQKIINEPMHFRNNNDFTYKTLSVNVGYKFNF